MAKANFPISNSQMFAIVMKRYPDICRRVVERMLGLEVRDIEYLNVEEMIPSLENRSVQLDVVLKDTGKTINLEMQTYDHGDLPRRMRYHRSIIDSFTTEKNTPFAKIDDCYVIFICTFDPFGKGLAQYTLKTTCEEDSGLDIDDGAVSIVYNATGDMEGLDQKTASLLHYFLTSAKDTDDDDELTRELADAVDEVNGDEGLTMGIQTYEQELLDRYNYGVRVGKEEGREEGRAEGELASQGRISALVAKMNEAGVPSDEIIAALSSSDMAALYERYGV